VPVPAVSSRTRSRFKDGTPKVWLLRDTERTMRERSRTPTDGPEPGRWKGLAAVAERWRAYLRAWGNLRAEAEEYREIDGERVLVLARNGGVGKTSGLDLAQIGESANVFHIRAGKVHKLVLYWNRECAFADLGIEE
jgi:hypothetical protein